MSFLVKQSSLLIKLTTIFSIIILIITPFSVFGESHNNKILEISEITQNILITSDADFDDFVLNYDIEGNGNETNPYIIIPEITALYSGFQINITNVSYYFVIRDGTISNGQQGGIYLEHVENVLIENNTISSNYLGIYFNDVQTSQILNNIITDHGQEAIRFENSSGNLIHLNKISLNGQDSSSLNLDTKFEGGISLNPSHDNVITNNTIENNNGDGIYLFKSNGNVIQFNNVSDSSDWGIRSRNSNDTEYINNRITGNGDLIHSLSGLHLNTKFEGGISLNPSQNNILQENIISGNAGDGILAFNLTELTINKNMILENGNNGIEIVSVEGAAIEENVITNNELYGIYSNGSNGIIISNNEITGNTAGSLYVVDFEEEITDITPIETTIFLPNPDDNTVTDELILPTYTFILILICLPVIRKKKK